MHERATPEPLKLSKLECLMYCFGCKSWSEAAGKASAVGLYSSDYGHSNRLSQMLARGITKAGAATAMVDVLSADAQVCYMLAAEHIYAWLP